MKAPSKLVAGELRADMGAVHLARACCVLAVDDSFEQSSRKVEAL